PRDVAGVVVIGQQGFSALRQEVFELLVAGQVGGFFQQLRRGLQKLSVFLVIGHYLEFTVGSAPYDRKEPGSSLLLGLGQRCNPGGKLILGYVVGVVTGLWRLH